MQSSSGRLDLLVDEALRVMRSPLPSDIADLAAQAISDVIICAIGGADGPEARASRAAFSGEGSVRIWGTEEFRDPVTAAFINGVTAHSLDYDDWAPGSGAHPSVAIVPALLAAAASRDVTGTQLLSAYAAAYELQERVGLSISPSHYEIGFHTTGIVGALGAACAAALILGVDRAPLRAAIAYAATGASGLKSLFGSAGKPLNAGNAASVGMRAALLASAGLAGPAADTVFGPQGLVPTHSTSVDEPPLAEPFGEPWHLRRLLFKFSSACFGTHGSIMAADVLRTEGIDLERVASVHITVPPITQTVCTIPDPRTGQEAKFSVAFTTAAALEGPMTTARFSEPFQPSLTARRLMDSTTLTFDDAYAKTQTAISLTLDDGTIRRAEADAGQPRWSVHPEEQWEPLRTKAHDLCDARIGADSVDRLVNAARRLHLNERGHHEYWA
ncbi:MmgE/PrpD family protein [Microbacterium sp. A94]|uniref:MmgE/PrpD family protein n=1 Tax=Microbacterium sp. A94 TaxID=3450717 RepID=UPI003F420108